MGGHPQELAGVGWGGVGGGDGSDGAEGETAEKNNENSAIVVLGLKLMDGDAISTAGSSTEQEDQVTVISVAAGVELQVGGSSQRS